MIVGIYMNCMMIRSNYIPPEQGYTLVDYLLVFSYTVTIERTISSATIPHAGLMKARRNSYLPLLWIDLFFFVIYLILKKTRMIAYAAL